MNISIPTSSAASAPIAGDHGISAAMPETASDAMYGNTLAQAFSAATAVQAGDTGDRAARMPRSVPDSSLRLPDVTARNVADAVLSKAGAVLQTIGDRLLSVNWNSDVAILGDLLINGRDNAPSASRDAYTAYTHQACSRTSRANHSAE
jgi:hypothetical protein